MIHLLVVEINFNYVLLKLDDGLETYCLNDIICFDIVTKEYMDMHFDNLQDLKQITTHFV